jgi:hypothetical protein
MSGWLFNGIKARCVAGQVWMFLVMSGYRNAVSIIAEMGGFGHPMHESGPGEDRYEGLR